jgi:UDP-N-acetyl-D-mannosaminuronate dehydrogenase
MTTIANALSELGITEWVLRGEPTTEAEFNEMFRKVTGADANGTAIESTDHGIAWATVAAKRDELIAAQPMKELRAERDRKLAATDWWAVADRTMTAEQTAYRQALRDITTVATSLDDVVWPVKP